MSSSGSTPTGPTVNASTPRYANVEDDNLSMPLGKYHPSKYKNPSAPSAQHARQTSDIKRKVQQYQREMAQQAIMASRLNSTSSGTKPISPRLLPLGSPGPVTPMELEESAGYLIAGAGSQITEQQSELVGRMIRAEEERRRREGQSSPTIGTH
jgi:hypothetical protein